MARNITETGSTYTDRSIIYLATGIDIGTPYSDTYTKRELKRPDSVSVPIVNGFRMPTNWLVTETSGPNFASGRVTWENYGYRYTYTGDSAGVITSFGALVPQDEPSANDTNRAAVQALLKIKDQKVNLSVAAAEMHKAVDMVASRTMSLVKALRAIRKGNVVAAAKALGVAPPKKSSHSKLQAQNWLELQYGWMPLLQDIHGAYELATMKQRTFGMTISGKSSVKRKYKDSGSRYLSAPFVGSYVDTGDLQTTVSLHYRVDSVALSWAAQAGLDNPLTVAWEITPFSFLVDWFIPIGNWIEAFTATQGLTLLGGSLTKYSRIERKNTIATDGTLKSSGQMTGVQKYFKMDRTVYTSTPVPIPYYKNPFSVAHGLNAIALLRAILK